jgi:glyoxylase-like metal-dependent hydrolase (beta-lactamase superfamily II)
VRRNSFFQGIRFFNRVLGIVKNGGDVVTLYNTLQELKQRIPDDATLYIGHDYFLSNLKFVSLLVFELELVKQYMDRIRREVWRIFLFNHGRRKKINPYLNADEKTFIKLREKRDNW